MCGIAGILNTNGTRPVAEDVLTKMISIIRHRGPDESGIYVDPHVGLGHVRLSIIGLEGGAQPICNEDGTRWIVYNGEVFNYKELKEELKSRGHVFNTSSDTEVVLASYKEWGEDCVKHFNGDWAFCIYDKSVIYFSFPGTGWE